MADNQPVSNLPLTALIPRGIEKAGALHQVVVIDQGGSGAESLVTSTNPFAVSTSVPSGVASGRKTIAVTNTAVQLIVASTPCKRVDIKAFSANVNDIVVGDSSIVYTLATRTGFFLSSGDSYHIEIDDVSKVYINGAINEGVTFTYYT